MSTNLVAITMPKWGLSMKEGSILKWIKSNGDNISKGDMILEIETEKVVNEMESPEDGKIIKICASEGDTVPVGSIIAVCGKHSYHGSTILSANASDQDINKFWGIQNPMSVHKFENADDLISICKGLYDMSFVIIEPVVGAGGVYDWSDDIWTILKEYQSKGGIVILDETVTGFGKLGTMFAFEKINFNPDMIILGKGITNGYFPMGACLINERIEKSVKMFNHGFTYSGHPVGCAAALETLKEIDKLDLEHKQINGVTRQFGCMGAIDFETPKQSLTFIKKMREIGYILEDGSENVSTAVFCLPYIFKDHTEFEEAIKCTITDI